MDELLYYTGAIMLMASIAVLILIIFIGWVVIKFMNNKR